MKKILALILVSLLAVSMLAGCAGTTVVINECNCPENTAGSNTEAAPSAGSETAEEQPAKEGALKTGMAVTTKVSDSTSAAADAEGTVKYDVTIAAVAVDDDGVIRACSIDSVPASLTIDANGAITSDLTAEILTKNELGADYGMVAYGNAVAEWDEQVAAFCEYAIGKTPEELRSGAIDESGKAPEGSDLATSATIYLGGYVAAVEAAANNAVHLGAQTGDDLKLVTQNSLAKSTAAAADAEGCAQLDTTIALVTVKDGVISSCLIDAVQAKINFDASGVITSDLEAQIPTKNELGADYGMVAYGNAIAEWNEQAAAFAAYVTGKTADEVAGIAIDEATKPADGSDLASSVTISIGGFQALIAKALG